MHRHVLCNQSSLRGPQCLMAVKGNTPARWTPPPHSHGKWLRPLSSGPSWGSQSEPPKHHLLRPPHGRTLLHGHQTGKANGVAGIAFSLIWAGDIQTPGCYQKLTAPPPPLGAVVPSTHMAYDVPWCGQAANFSNWDSLYPVFPVSLVPHLGMGMTCIWRSTPG